METKTCTECKEEKSLEEFQFRNKAKGIRKMRCKDCCHVYGKKHYDNNREKYIDKAHEYNPLLLRRNRLFVIRYLREHPCVDCGEQDIVVLEFDHVRGEKRDAISNMVRHRLSLATLMEEIAKCEVRCANCHRKKHAKESGDSHWYNGDLMTTEEELQNTGRSEL